MLTQEQVLSAIKAGRESKCIDCRDYSRLADFFPKEQWGIFGFEIPEKDITPKPWTEEEILKQLAADVEFGFKKALDQRGISSSSMYNVIKMWMWVLEDDLQYYDNYPNYGLPLFKAVALKYDLENPIGDDTGKEVEYAS